MSSTITGWSSDDSRPATPSHETSHHLPELMDAAKHESHSFKNTYLIAPHENSHANPLSRTNSTDSMTFTDLNAAAILGPSTGLSEDAYSFMAPYTTIDGIKK